MDIISELEEPEPEPEPETEPEPEPEGKDNNKSIEPFLKSNWKNTIFFSLGIGLVALCGYYFFKQR